MPDLGWRSVWRRGLSGDRRWEQCPVEKCVFRKIVTDNTGKPIYIFLTTYVDNLFFAFPLGHDYLKDAEIAALNSTFVLNDLGRVAFSLGARIKFDFSLNQCSIAH